MSKRLILLSALLVLVVLLSSCSQFAWRSHAFYSDHGPRIMRFSLSAPDKLSVKACPDLSSGFVSVELSGNGKVLFNLENLSSSCEKAYVEITNVTAGNYTLHVDFSDDAKGELMFHWAVDSRP